MAGYVINLKSFDSLNQCIKNGVYSTNLSAPKNMRWMAFHEGTFADYMSMKEGDNVYFFIKRKIYGIGVLKNISLDCKYQNYPEALCPSVPDYQQIKDTMLIAGVASNIDNRVVCLFQPSPNFFMNGIDMDDVLASNPSSFRMLRAFWKLSFIKIDDEENKALKDIILKRNEDSIGDPNHCHSYDETEHIRIQGMVNDDYIISSAEVLRSSVSGEEIRHEMAIEAGIVDILSSQPGSCFGFWDYVSHQVVASPFKPIDYMDKMDIFGYRYIPGFDTISKYLLIEIKKDQATTSALDQLMKYVDWINQEYAFGDYSMIEAFLVASDFPQNVVEYRDSVCIRNFTKGSHPAVPETWKNVKLVKYRFDAASRSLGLDII